MLSIDAPLRKHLLLQYQGSEPDYELNMGGSCTPSIVF
jgi:hypothetical protein